MGREGTGGQTVVAPAGRASRADAFTAIYREFFAPVYGYVSRRADAAEVDDIVAASFTTAWRHLDDIPPPPGTRPYLLRIAARAITDHQRTSRRFSRLHLRLAAQPVAHVAPPELPDEQVSAALAALSAKDREALKLVLWDDLPHSEAAAILGCTANALEIRLRRARAELRAQLGMPASPSPGDAP